MTDILLFLILVVLVLIWLQSTRVGQTIGSRLDEWSIRRARRRRNDG